MVTPNNALDERRYFERFTTRFPAKFKDARQDLGDQVYLRDASAEGVKLTSREQLFINDNVALEVKVADGHEHPMNIAGKLSGPKMLSPVFGMSALNATKLIFCTWRVCIMLLFNNLLHGIEKPGIKTTPLAGQVCQAFFVSNISL